MENLPYYVPYFVYNIFSIDTNNIDIYNIIDVIRINNVTKNAVPIIIFPP